MDERDKNRILVKLDDMTRYINELRDMLPSRQEYLDDLVKRRACEKTVESAIECMIDAGAIIVSAEKLGLPRDEESIFDLLAGHGVIPEGVSRRAKEMKGFRNILIHRYCRCRRQDRLSSSQPSPQRFPGFQRSSGIIPETIAVPGIRDVIASMSNVGFSIYGKITRCNT